MATCREISHLPDRFRGGEGGVNPSGQPDRFFPVFFLMASLSLFRSLFDIHKFKTYMTILSQFSLVMIQYPVAAPIDNSGAGHVPLLEGF